MSTTVKINLNSTEEILKVRNLENGGQAQRFFTSEVKRFADKMTPMDTGTLKSNATIDVDSITYNSPYARYQYYGISKNGKAFNYEGSPTRGAKWIERTWANDGKTIIQSVANFVGGKAE